MVDDSGKPLNAWRRFFHGRTELASVTRIARLEREVSQLKRRLAEVEERLSGRGST